MHGVLKKWLENAWGMRVVLAFLYLLTSFSVPLNHTCQPAHKDVHNHHPECTGHRLLSDEHVKVRSVVAFSQHDITETAKSHNKQCLACLYSLAFKAFNLCSNTFVCPIQSVVRAQILSQLSFAKRPEWFSSISLRAPPSTIS